jgi:hypothetical protein
MVNDPLPGSLQAAEIAGLFLPQERSDMLPRSWRNLDIIEIAAFFGLARFLHR